MCSMFNKSKDINSVQNWNGKFSYQCLCFSLPPAIPGNKLILHYFPSTGWLFCDMAADFSQSKREIWESEAGAEVPLWLCLGSDTSPLLLYSIQMCLDSVWEGATEEQNPQAAWGFGDPGRLAMAERDRKMRE